MNEFFGLLYKECPRTLEGYGRNQHKLTKNRGFSENLSYKSKIFRGFLGVTDEGQENGIN